MKAGNSQASQEGSEPTALPILVGIVEDDFEVRARFETAVRLDPRLALVFSVATYRQATEAGASRPVNVLLVDLGLPDRDGREVIGWFARHQPDTIAMVITVFGDEQHVITSFEAGAVGYLLKDLPIEELSQHIIDLHAGGSPISPAVARSVIRRFSQVHRVTQSDSNLLSPRELEVLRLVEKGLTYDEIAQNLDVTWHTVTGYLRRVYRKLEVNSRSQAVFEARLMGIL
ncbi:response regulator [Hydrogenophaga sp. RWCD_12]|uniref:response regulator n=1 Tax=Hydrogenophaga sp. RWCD_12 TaxID=3391190 RepID=UPI0039855633